MGTHLGGKISENHDGFLSGGGELGELIRKLDWSRTSLGEVSKWPQSLRSALSICLNSNFPIAIYWGKDLTLLYNDAWKAIPGNKHPAALGLPAMEVWPEIWADIEPQFQKAFSGLPGGSKDALLPMQRHGYTEECYFDFTFTPIYGEEGKVEGVFNAVIETTYRVVNERRTALLKKLPLRLAQCVTCDQVYGQAMDLVKEFSKDIPFALLSVVTQPEQPELIVSTGNLLPPDQLWKRPLPVHELISSATSLHIDKLDEFLRDIPNGFWPETPVEALTVPLKDSKGAVNGFIFFGLNARIRYDGEYKIFLEGIASAITTVAHNIVALEAERRRTDELLELDKAKTAFFTNISHEFRTPLTLLLGPLEQFLADPTVLESQRVQIEPVYRNALRMQKLVNTLLEFSRIEAGRVEAHYVQVDIGLLTADLVSTFRSAVEMAGMELHIAVSPVSPDVYVDPQMWEKIILNLVSNAFKYTLQGSITITVRQIDTWVEVSVIDTGCGIPNEHLDKLFDRFHRIERVVGRSQEGTGIGLALVKELIGLHSGTIHVESEPGLGSKFTVRIPVGKAHLGSKSLSDSASLQDFTVSNPYRIEALNWAAQNADNKASGPPAPADIVGSHKYSVLVADDNPDMREYITRLLSDQFAVRTAVDGEEAYALALAHKPDLVVSDIMMPVLDGFGLLKKMRSHPELKATPVIFLSARAGQEAKVEGLNAGADDYLVKPFAAKELIVRVSNHIRINQVRRQTEQQFYQLFLQAPAIINVFRGPEHIYEIFHPHNKHIFGDVDYTGMRLIDALPELDSQGIVPMLDEVYQSRKTIIQDEMPVVFAGKDGKAEKHYFNLTYQPWFDHRGNIQGVLNFAIDVTAQIEAKSAIEKSERNLRNIITQAPVPMCIFRGDAFVVETANTRMLELWGKSYKEVLNRAILEGIPEIKGQGYEELLAHVYTTGERYTESERSLVLNRNGRLEQAYVNFLYEALRENDGSISGVMAVAMEVTEQVMARRKIEEAEEKARLAIESADLGTYEIDLLTNEMVTSRRFNEIWGIGPVLTRDSLADRIHPDDHEIRDIAHRRAGETGKLDYETRVIWPNGALHWVRVKGKIIYDEDGTAMTLIGVAQDITEQKHFSEQLHLLVQERTMELQRSNEDLQQFAHVASHDLKEPVRKIKLFGSRLQTEYAPLLPEKARGFIQKIQQATDRMFSMIDGVLVYSSMNAHELKMQPVDLNEVIEGIESDLEVIIEQKGALIERRHLPAVKGTPVLIYQLFYNLINNALKFAKADEPPVIVISAGDCDNDKVAVAVSDNGIGFDQKYADHIFETFTRLNGKDAYEGTGLGLALCKKIAERHQGTITVESVPGVGTKFILTLPSNNNNK